MAFNFYHIRGRNKKGFTEEERIRLASALTAIDGHLDDEIDNLHDDETQMRLPNRKRIEALFKTLEDVKTKTESIEIPDFLDDEDINDGGIVRKQDSFDDLEPAFHMFEQCREELTGLFHALSVLAKKGTDTTAFVEEVHETLQMARKTVHRMVPAPPDRLQLPFARSPSVVSSPVPSSAGGGVMPRVASTLSINTGPIGPNSTAASGRTGYRLVPEQTPVKPPPPIVVAAPVDTQPVDPTPFTVLDAKPADSVETETETPGGWVRGNGRFPREGRVKATLVDDVEEIEEEVDGTDITSDSSDEEEEEVVEEFIDDTGVTRSRTVTQRKKKEKTKTKTKSMTNTKPKTKTKSRSKPQGSHQRRRTRDHTDEGDEESYDTESDASESDASPVRPRRRHHRDHPRPTESTDDSPDSSAPSLVSRCESAAQTPTPRGRPTRPTRPRAKSPPPAPGAPSTDVLTRVGKGVARAKAVNAKLAKISDVIRGGKPPPVDPAEDYAVVPPAALLETLTLHGGQTEREAGLVGRIHLLEAELANMYLIQSENRKLAREVRAVLARSSDLEALVRMILRSKVKLGFDNDGKFYGLQ